MSPAARESLMVLVVGMAGGAADLVRGGQASAWRGYGPRRSRHRPGSPIDPL